MIELKKYPKGHYGKLLKCQDKIKGLEAELKEVLDVLYKVSPEHLGWIKMNYPDWRKDEN